MKRRMRKWDDEGEDSFLKSPSPPTGNPAYTYRCVTSVGKDGSVIKALVRVPVVMVDGPRQFGIFWNDRPKRKKDQK